LCVTIFNDVNKLSNVGEASEFLGLLNAGRGKFREEGEIVPKSREEGRNWLKK